MFGFTEWMNTYEYYPLNKKEFEISKEAAKQVRMFTSNCKYDLFLSLTPTEIETLKNAFQGGVTHVNTGRMDKR